MVRGICSTGAVAIVLILMDAFHGDRLVHTSDRKEWHELRDRYLDIKNNGQKEGKSCDTFSPHVIPTMAKVTGLKTPREMEKKYPGQAYDFSEGMIGGSKDWTVHPRMTLFA